MKSRRSWLIGLALGAALFFGAPSAKAQTALNSVPRTITYQGVLLNGGVPVNGNVTLDFYFNDSLGFVTSGATINPIYHQTISNVVVTDGIFNVWLGDPLANPPGFPESMKFDKQYLMTVQVNGVTVVTQPLESSPYALNTQRAGGLDVSPLPVNGDLFPMPLTPAGKIDPSMLPTIPENLLQTPPVLTVNGTSPDGAGNIQLVPGTGITISNGPGSQITINSSGGGLITSVLGEGGLEGGGTSGNLVLQIAPGGITANDIATGAISGQKITGIAGSGLMQDASGFLDVNVDNSTIGITSQLNGNYLEVLPGGIGTVQLANGSVSNSKLQNSTIGLTNPDGSLTIGGSPIPLGGSGTVQLALGHTNSWTILQNFTNITDVGAITNTGTLTNTGVLTQTGGNVSLAGSAGNTTTIGLAGGGNSTTVNGGLTQSGGNVSMATTAGNTVSLGNTTGSTTITGALSQNTGNVSFTPGATNTFSVSNPTGTNTITGTTNINTGVSAATNIGGGGGTNTITGPTNINTSGTALTTIGSTTSGSATTINGNVNSGASSNSLVNSFGVGANALNVANTFGSQGAGSTNTFYGTTAFTTVPAGTNGTRVTITGAVTPTITSNNDYELIVNGDAQITGTLNVGTFTATTINTTTLNATTVNVSGTLTANTGDFTTLNVTGASSLNTLTTSGAITDNADNLTIVSSNVQGTQVESNAVSGGGHFTYTWPDSSGTVALLSNIAQIAQGTAPGQTLWWTGNAALPNNSWQPTNDLLNRPDLNSITVASATTLYANGPVNVGGALTVSSLISLTGGPMNSTDVTTIGTINTDQTWLTVQGLASTWTSFPFGPLSPNPPTLPATSPFAVNDFESIVKGDLEVTGTIYDAAIYSGLVATQHLRFDDAAPFTPGGTMTFDGGISPTASGTPVITINNIPAGSFGEQVNGSATGAGGIQVTGAGAGTGVVIDPFPIGLDISAINTGIAVGGTGNIGVPAMAIVNPATGLSVMAVTTGETLDMQTAGAGTGLTIGASSAPSIGQTINATATGLTTTAPTALNTVGVTNLNVGVSSNTNINTGNSDATISIGNTTVPSTTDMLGVTNINATSGSADATNIGNANSTTTILGPTNINATGGATTDIATTTAAATNIGVSGGTTTVLGTADINNTGGGTTNIGASAAAPTNIGVLGGTNTIAGTTTINNNVNANTSITTGSSTGTTTIGNSSAGEISLLSGASTAISLDVNSVANNLQLGNIAAGSSTDAAFLDMTTVPTGDVRTRSIGSIITGSNGVEVTYSGSSADAHFGPLSTSVPFQTNRFVNLDVYNLNFTSDGGTLNPFVITGGAAPTINTLGTTNLNVTGGATTNIATTTAALTNIGVVGGTNTILGLTDVNVTGGSTTNIATTTAAATNIGVSGGTTTVLGTADINNTGGGTTNIGASAAAPTNIGVLGGTNTIAGTTTINNNVNANTSITTGSSTGTTTIGNSSAGEISLISDASTAISLNVDDVANNLQLANIANGSNTDAVFLDMTTNTTGNVRTRTIGSIITGSNGVDVSYTGSSADAHFAGDNSTVAFTTDRYINIDANNLLVTSNGGALTPFEITGGAAPTINTLGTTNLNVTGGAATNIATTDAANTNIGVVGGTNTIIGETDINNNENANTQITTGTSTGTTTIGNGNTASASTAIVGAATATSTGQALDELTVSNTSATGGKWSERATSAPTAGSALGLIATASAIAGQNATAGKFTGASGNNIIGVQTNVSGGTTTNVGEDVTSAGIGSVGIRVNSTAGGAGTGGPNTGVSIDASNALGATAYGMDITGVTTTGANVTFTTTVTSGSVYGYNVDMNGVGGGATFSGYHVSNLNSVGQDGINIQSMSAGNGIAIGSMTGGVGINIGMASASAVGIDVDASAGGGATALKVVGNGTGEPGTSTALEVSNGQIRATGVNQFAGRVAFVYDGSGQQTITNGLVGPGSSIIATYENVAANGDVTAYAVSVYSVSSGSFVVNCTAPNPANTTYIDYIIINH